MRIAQFLLLVVCSVASVRAQCSPGGIAVVVNKATNVESVSLQQLRKLMLGDVRSWPDRSTVVIVGRESSGVVYKCALSAVVRMSDAEYRKYIMNAEFRGEDPVPILQASSARSAAMSVAGVVGGFTFIETSLLSQMPGSLKVVKIDGKAPGEPGYPL